MKAAYIISGAAALLAAGAVLCVKRPQAAPPAAASVPAPAAAETRPLLSFPQSTVDVTVAGDAPFATVEFPFENRSDKPITIASVERNCTCVQMGISGKGKLVYAPGESGVIQACYELGNFSGTVEKPFGLFLAGDPPDRPSHTLTPRIHIPVLVEIPQKTVRWDAGGAGGVRKVDILMRDSRPIHVTGAFPSLPGFAAEVHMLEDGKRYQVWITPETVADPALCLVRIETDSDVPRWRTQQVFAVVQEPPPAPAKP